MSTLSPPLPVKFFVGMIAGDPTLFQACEAEISRELGPVDFRSPLIPWIHTDYYADEMGTGLQRRFLFFARTGEPGRLVDIKLATQALEERLSEVRGDRSCRRVNIDPGYLTEAKVVLATGKDFPHRISIGRGVYAEATLRYSKEARGFVAVEHTYPDFRGDEVRRWFTEARERLRKEMGRT